MASSSVPFHVFLKASGPPGQGPVLYSPIAVDEKGTPLAVQPMMTLDPTDPTNVTVYNGNGTASSFQPEIYEPGEYSVFIQATRDEGGTISYSPVAVDASGTPLAVQPLMTSDPADPTNVTVYDISGTGSTLRPEQIYELTPGEYEVFLEVSGIPGMGALSYTPIAVDGLGNPLPIQPLMTVDFKAPDWVSEWDTDGTMRDWHPHVSEPQGYSVFLEASGTPGMGTVSYSPVAVDASGTPLPVQPLMTLDPMDPTQVTVYDAMGSVSTYQPNIYEPRVYSVFLEASGTPGHGTISYSPIALDASGTPLPIQPLMTLDPTDPTKVTLYDIKGVPSQLEQGPDQPLPEAHPPVVGGNANLVDPELGLLVRVDVVDRGREADDLILVGRHGEVVPWVLKELMDEIVTDGKIEHVRVDVPELRLVTRAEERDVWQCPDV